MIYKVRQFVEVKAVSIVENRIDYIAQVLPIKILNGLYDERLRLTMASFFYKILNTQSRHGSFHMKNIDHIHNCSDVKVCIKSNVQSHNAPLVRNRPDLANLIHRLILHN